MATYVISDIHGYYDQFQELLDTVSPTSDDTVIVAGDIIDRGPKSRRMLTWAMKEAPSNVEFLLGNHEDMFASAITIARNAERDGHSPYYELDNHPWVWNVRHAQDVLWLYENLESGAISAIKHWIDNLPLYKDITVSGKRFLIVHAGFDPREWQPDARWVWQDALKEDGARSETADIQSIGLQYSQDMLWVRHDWYNRQGIDPVDIVCGHTPNVPDNMNLLPTRLLPDEETDVTPYGMCHIQTRHFIDCGSAYRNRDRKCDLGILRLDDMAAFYHKKGGPHYPSQAYLDYLKGR